MSIFIIFIIIINLNVAYSQNEYYNIKDYFKCENKVVIDGENSLKKGDLVFIIQMNGAEIDRTNSDKYGDLVSYNGAGQFEFNEILKIEDKEISLKYEVKPIFDFKSNIQLIKVNKNKNLTITQNPNIPAFDGKKGGVLVLYAEDYLTLETNIDVTGKGFIGGDFYNSQQTTARFESEFSYPHNSDLAANKGEGIVKFNDIYGAGRGKNANGGGGGNAHNAGGGGGGNLSFGGIGGDPHIQANEIYEKYENGLGGGITYFINYPLILGGGGGAGHGNNNVGTSGASGGGIIVISCKNLIGSNINIIANGNNVTKIAGNDGSGGGGGGGSILLIAENVFGKVDLIANGGNGGNSNNREGNNVLNGGCHGPGGGGGGGTIYLSQVLNNLTINVNGGLPGTILESTLGCRGTNYNAKPGESGKEFIIPSVFLTKKEFVIPKFDLQSISIGECFDSKYYLKLNRNTNIKSIKWNNNSTKDSIQIFETGKYTIEIIDINDCVYYIDTLIRELKKVNFGVKESQFNQKLFRTGGNFKLKDKGIILTENKSLQVGHLWLRDKLNIKKGFTTNFAFRVYNGINNKMFEQSYPGADGFALIFQNFKREIVGSSGGGIGFVGIPNSLAIEIDLFGNYLSLDNIYDPNGNHLAVFSNKELPNIADHTSKALIKEKTDMLEVLGDSSVYYFNLNYDNENKKLEVSVSKTLNDFSNSLILNDFDFGDYIKLDQNQYSFIGISAATGTAIQIHEVIEWQLCGETKDNITSVEEDYNYFDDNHKNNEIYPNPVFDYLNIKNTENYQEMKIFNIIGNEIKIQNITDQLNIKINISEFESGIYFYQLISEKTTFFGKFVKE